MSWEDEPVVGLEWFPKCSTINLHIDFPPFQMLQLSRLPCCPHLCIGWWRESGGVEVPCKRKHPMKWTDESTAQSLFKRQQMFFKQAGPPHFKARTHPENPAPALPPWSLNLSLWPSNSSEVYQQRVGEWNVMSLHVKCLCASPQLPCSITCSSVS
jgi:hypothetical protein